MVNGVDDHERKIQPCDLRPYQERLHLCVDLPKQKPVCLIEKETGERKKGKSLHEGYSDTDTAELSQGI